MEISSLSRQVHAINLPLDRLVGNPNISEKEKVGEVSRQFEAVMLRQILSEAQKKVFKSSANPESTVGGVYQDMVTNQLADSISRSGGFGLARGLEKQLQHEFKTVPPPARGDIHAEV